LPKKITLFEETRDVIRIHRERSPLTNIDIRNPFSSNLKVFFSKLLYYDIFFFMHDGRGGEHTKHSRFPYVIAYLHLRYYVSLLVPNAALFLFYTPPLSVKSKSMSARASTKRDLLRDEAFHLQARA